MSGHTLEDVKKSIKKYWLVFAALTIGTVVTVALAGVHLGILVGIVAALFVATFKGALVVGYFMHLFSERKLIYVLLGFTALFAVVMLGLIMWTHGDQQGDHSGVFKVQSRIVQPHDGGGHGAVHSESREEKH